MRSAFVTGAATGIGEALVVRLQREGWQVFAAHRASSPDRARWAGRPNVSAVPCDVTDADAVRAAAETVASHTGGTLDLLVNRLIGPKVGALPWMHRLLSAQQVQNVWRRMFSVKSSRS